MFPDSVSLQGQGFTLKLNKSLFLVNLTIDDKVVATKRTLDEDSICMIIPFITQLHRCVHVCTCVIRMFRGPRTKISQGN